MKRFTYSSRALVVTSLAATLSLFAAAPMPSESSNVDAAAALVRLQSGNRRFVESEVSAAKPFAQQRRTLANGQHPFAIIIACADSRTAPEIVFDHGLGDLFVIRTAGNLVDDYALGSIEYAVTHLGARLVVVLGHERCGAVDAALKGGEAPGHVRALVDAIAPAVKRAKAAAAAGDPLDAAIAENARLVAKKIRESQPALAELAKSEVKVVAARYDLDTGVVSWLP